MCIKNAIFRLYINANNYEKYISSFLLKACKYWLWNWKTYGSLRCREEETQLNLYRKWDKGNREDNYLR